MTHFVKDLNKNYGCFKYGSETFSSLSEAKLKEEIFVGPHKVNEK